MGPARWATWQGPERRAGRADAACAGPAAGLASDRPKARRIRVCVLSAARRPWFPSRMSRVRIPSPAPPSPSRMTAECGCVREIGGRGVLTPSRAHRKQPVQAGTAGPATFCRTGLRAPGDPRALGSGRHGTHHGGHLRLEGRPDGPGCPEDDVGEWGTLSRADDALGRFDELPEVRVFDDNSFGVGKHPPYASNRPGFSVSISRHTTYASTRSSVNTVSRTSTIGG